MTDRDHMIAAALQGLLASGTMRSGYTGMEIAERAIRLADEIMAQRKRVQNPTVNLCEDDDLVEIEAGPTCVGLSKANAIKLAERICALM